MIHLQDSEIAHAFILECECGSKRSVGLDPSSKTWSFHCKECKRWIWLPRGCITKETIMEWARLGAVKELEKERLLVTKNALSRQQA